MSKVEKRLTDGKFYGQVTYEKGFATKEEAQRWTWEQDSKLTREAEVDSFSTTVWEPS